MKVLFTAFNGKSNSSKLLLDKINSDNKLYLRNSFSTSVNQLKKELNSKNYGLIISFGQAHLDKDTIKIETIGQDKIKYKTKYDFTSLEETFCINNYKTIISNNAGAYLCNNIYFNGLKYIDDNKLNTKMIFIHIPAIDNISNIDNLANIFN